LRQRIGGGTGEVGLGGLAVTFSEGIDYFDQPRSAPAWHRSSPRHRPLLDGVMQPRSDHDVLVIIDLHPLGDPSHMVHEQSA
jgi:hypothetical protein